MSASSRFVLNFPVFAIFLCVLFLCDLFASVLGGFLDEITKCCGQPAIFTLTIVA